MQDRQAVEFAQLLLRVLDEGRRTGTHKLVTLLALSSALERSVDTNSGLVPDWIPISMVADEVFEVMWQQVAPFVPLHGGEAVRLRQMRPNGRGAYVFFEATLQAHQAAESLERPTWQQLCLHDPALADRLRTDVVRTLVKNPLPRLQVFGSATVPFVYHWPWGPDRSPTSVARQQGRPEPAIEFVPGAAELMLAFAPMARPVVESVFIADIARYNGMSRAENALRDHLFGSARISVPPKLLKELHELQDGRCFYEPDGPALPMNALDVDHFVPWIRHPNNAVENLVVAHESCNRSKNDLFATPEHLERWTAQLKDRQDIGTELGFSYSNVFSDLARSVGIARRGYQLLPDGFPLWRQHQPGQGRILEPLNAATRSELTAVLATVSPSA